MFGFKYRLAIAAVIKKKLYNTIICLFSVTRYTAYYVHQVHSEVRTYNKLQTIVQ